MNIFLLGNGFDLKYNLPTSYSNFIHTVNFLKDNYNSSVDTIGQVFGNEALQVQDSAIKVSYEKYKCVYDAIPLSQEVMLDLVDKA